MPSSSSRSPTCKGSSHIPAPQTSRSASRKWRQALPSRRTGKTTSSASIFLLSLTISKSRPGCSWSLMMSRDWVCFRRAWIAWWLLMSTWWRLTRSLLIVKLAAVRVGRRQQGAKWANAAWRDLVALQKTYHSHHWVKYWQMNNSLRCLWVSNQRKHKIIIGRNRTIKKRLSAWTMSLLKRRKKRATLKLLRRSPELSSSMTNLLICLLTQQKST